jgi:predicted RNA-binding Zn-ribbon protein involved in translation (DUF1610 family)
MTKRQAFFRCVLFSIGTVLLLPIAFVAPVFIAVLIQDIRGVPRPIGFDPLISGSYFCGFCMVIIVGMAGIRFTTGLWSRYVLMDDAKHCLRCNYPLQGLPKKSYMCPECGFVIPRASSDDSQRQSAEASRKTR